MFSFPRDSLYDETMYCTCEDPEPPWQYALERIQSDLEEYARTGKVKPRPKREGASKPEEKKWIKKMVETRRDSYPRCTGILPRLLHFIIYFMVRCLITFLHVFHGLGREECEITFEMMDLMIQLAIELGKAQANGDGLYHNGMAAFKMPDWDDIEEMMEAMKAQGGLPE